MALTSENLSLNEGAYLATDNTDNPMAEPAGLGHQAIATLEAQIDLMVSRLPEMRCFILPGGTVASAQAQVCRAVCRRAERRVVALAAEARVDDIVIIAACAVSALASVKALALSETAHIRSALRTALGSAHIRILSFIHPGKYRLCSIHQSFLAGLKLIDIGICQGLHILCPFEDCLEAVDL